MQRCGDNTHSQPSLPSDPASSARLIISLSASTSLSASPSLPASPSPPTYLIALSLVHGGKGVHVSKLWPRDGDHLRSGVQLHGAGAEGDHGVDQRQVLGLKERNGGGRGTEGGREDGGGE